MASLTAVAQIKVKPGHKSLKEAPASRIQSFVRSVTAAASLPALLLLLTIEILTSLLHFIHQLLRRRKIKLILAGDNRLVILRQRHLHSRVILLRAK